MLKLDRRWRLRHGAWFWGNASMRHLCSEASRRSISPYKPDKPGYRSQLLRRPSSPSWLPHTRHEHAVVAWPIPLVLALHSRHSEVDV